MKIPNEKVWFYKSNIHIISYYDVQKTKLSINLKDDPNNYWVLITDELWEILKNKDIQFISANLDMDIKDLL